MSSERNPVTNRSAWRPDEMNTDRSWSFTLDEAHIQDLEKALFYLEKMIKVVKNLEENENVNIK